MLVDGYEIVDDDFLDNPVDPEGDFVDAFLIVFLIAEDALDDVGVFREGSQRGEEVAVAHVVVDDVARLDFAVKESGLPD
jgi:hypothetical protein